MNLAYRVKIRPKHNNNKLISYHAFFFNLSDRRSRRCYGLCLLRRRLPADLDVGNENDATAGGRRERWWFFLEGRRRSERTDPVVGETMTSGTPQGRTVQLLHLLSPWLWAFVGALSEVNKGLGRSGAAGGEDERRP